MNETKTIELPDALHSLFWDCDFRTLSWEKHRDFIISRILTRGTWESVQWLRATLSDNGLKHWLLEKKGANLDSRRLRFWELILELEPETANTWIKSKRASPWGRENIPMNVHHELLIEEQTRVLEMLAPVMTENDFYLVGGTAIALLLGHRQSVDLDWFTENPIPDVMQLAQTMKENERIAK